MDMTEREPGGEQAEQPARRPSPGPSPTSRARRAAAAGVEARRPRPSHPATANGAGTATVPPPDSAPPADLEPAIADRPTEPLWLAVLLAVLVLAGAAAVVAATRLSFGAGSVGDRDRALSAAKSEVPVILSYSYRSFDADVAKARAQLTGRAVTDYTTAMAQTIKPTAIKVKAVVQAQTDGAGVESVSPDGKQVTFVVFGEQKVTNSSLAAPRTDLFRVRATLDLVGGHWLISKFDQI
jgi:Mce-associated membrane protein